ncbi:Uncharacterised protein [Segatella copri]|nr:Uncharacterised protein [Segatella copri]
MDGEGVDRQIAQKFFRLLRYQFQGILEYQKIEFVGIMMGSRKRNGIELFITVLYHSCMHLVMSTAMITTAEHQEDAQHTKNLYRPFLFHLFLTI